MAEKAIDGGLRVVSSNQLVRRNLRVAIRQVERAELYVNAVESLNLGDEAVDEWISDLERRLRALRVHLAHRRAASAEGAP